MVSSQVEMGMVLPAGFVGFDSALGKVRQEGFAARFGRS
jgi:hypothetical protein